MSFFAVILILFAMVYYKVYHSPPIVLAQKMRRSTVRIKGYFKEKDLFFNDEVNWHGSGVIIDKTAECYVILTNLHVIGFWELYNSDLATPEIEEYSLDIQTDQSQEWMTVTKILVNTQLKDFALLYIKTSKHYPILTLNPSHARQGSQVYAMGHPSGLNFTLTSGIISGFRQTESDLGIPYQVIQTDTPINPGNSGGPLVDGTGHLVGIVVSKIVKKGIDGLNFAISSEEIVSSIEHDEFLAFPLKTHEIGKFVENLKNSFQHS